MHSGGGRGSGGGGRRRKGVGCGVGVGGRGRVVVVAVVGIEVVFVVRGELEVRIAVLPIILTELEVTNAVHCKSRYCQFKLSGYQL